MADTLRQALANRRSPLAAIDTNAAAEMLDAPQPSALALVDRAHEASAPSMPAAAAALDTGPGQWLVVSARDTPAALVTQLADQCDDAAITDLSHARFRIRLQGPNARDVLQSGIAIDLGAAAFPPGRSTPTAFRDIAVLVHAAGEQTFDLYVFRSYARSLWEWLADAAKHC